MYTTKNYQTRVVSQKSEDGPIRSQVEAPVKSQSDPSIIYEENNKRISLAINIR